MTASARIVLGIVLLVVPLRVQLLAQQGAPPQPAPAAPAVPNAPPAPLLAKDLYEKWERRIAMRDGVELHTAIYLPKETGSPHPIVLTRTPYSCTPYGEEKFREQVGPSPLFMTAHYIVVYQDVRGCFESGGEWDDMRPIVHDAVDAKSGAAPATAVDDSTDTWDTIDWLVKNVPNHNGRVGLWGISYPGFFTSAGMIDAHPALRAASPQAPIADWFFDDFHHHGAFFLPHFFNFMWGFGKPRKGLTTEFRRGGDHGSPDGYQFFLDLGGLSNVDPKWYHDEIPYWKVFAAHPNYDDYWRARNLLPHLRHVAPAVMTVGGWFDAEDLYGALQTYRAVERLNPGIVNLLVMGPWAHGGWSRSDGDRLGNVRFGGRQSAFYREQIEFRFFEEHLRPEAAKAGGDAKGASAPASPMDGAALGAPLAEANVFETGANRWRSFAEWPPKETTAKRFYLRGDSMVALDEPPAEEQACDRFVSDPKKPVPFTEAVANGMTREYMTDDQRFAARRPDVLTYETGPLDGDVTFAGPLCANLWVATSQQDCDWIVKLVDVFPGDFKYPPESMNDTKDDRSVRPPTPPIPMGGYEMMVRSEVIRGRFRDSYSDPKPFTPGQPTLVKLPLQDVLHTFQKGHRIMFQVQSTWFPLVDRNPQQWVDNIYMATDRDFVAAEHRLFREKAHASFVEVGVLPAAAAPAQTKAAPDAAGTAAGQR